MTVAPPHPTVPGERALHLVRLDDLVVPVVDVAYGLVESLLALLAQPDGRRPVVVDEHRGHRPAGLERWVRNGFLDPRRRVTLGSLGCAGPPRAAAGRHLRVRASELAASGAGVRLHAASEPLPRPMPWEYQVPRRRGPARWRQSLPGPNPVALRHRGGYVLRATTPPTHPSTGEAVNAVLADRFGPHGWCRDGVHEVDAEVVAGVRAVCGYVFDTYGRFPAHRDALTPAGGWLEITPG